MPVLSVKIERGFYIKNSHNISSFSHFAILPKIKKNGNFSSFANHLQIFQVSLEVQKQRSLKYQINQIFLVLPSLAFLFAYDDDINDILYVILLSRFE